MARLAHHLSLWFDRRGWRDLIIGVPYLWLLLLFLLPFAIVLKISFAEADVAIPPYTDIFAYADQQLQVLGEQKR